MNYSECGFPIIDDEVDYDEIFDRKSNKELKSDEKDEVEKIPNSPLFD